MYVVDSNISLRVDVDGSKFRDVENGITHVDNSSLIEMGLKEFIDNLWKEFKMIWWSLSLECSFQWMGWCHTRNYTPPCKSHTHQDFPNEKLYSSTFFNFSNMAMSYGNKLIPINKEGPNLSKLRSSSILEL